LKPTRLRAEVRKQPFHAGEDGQRPCRPNRSAGSRAADAVIQALRRAQRQWRFHLTSRAAMAPGINE